MKRPYSPPAVKEVTPLKRSDLDNLPCMGRHCPDHDRGDHRTGPMMISGNCHKTAPAVASYWGGVITFSCWVCGAIVVKVSVAE